MKRPTIDEIVNHALRIAQGEAIQIAWLADGHEFTESDWLEEVFPLGLPEGFM